MERNRIAITREIQRLNRQTFSADFMPDEFRQSRGYARLIESRLPRSLIGVDEDEFPVALREIEAIPKLVGLPARIGEPVRLDPVAEGERRTIGARTLRRDANGGEQSKRWNDDFLEQLCVHNNFYGQSFTATEPPRNSTRLGSAPLPTSCTW